MEEADQSSADSDYRLQEIGMPQPENLTRLWPQTSSNFYSPPRMTGTVAIEHNEILQHPSGPKQTGVNQHEPLSTENRYTIPDSPLSIINQEVQTRVENNGNLERKIDRLTELVGRILLEIEELKLQRGKNEVLNHTDLRDEFPFTSLEKLKEFEARLEDEEEKKKVTQYFKSIGGLTSKDFHSRVMARVFTNSLAMQCSWKGFKNNYKVESMLLLQCLYCYDTVSHNKHGIASEPEIQDSWKTTQGVTTDCDSFRFS
ncbi:uncharacterized protein LOC123306708 [Coccinella septempunctata]|uniref:uncharacterized protein LOC123306705 n=1 Tax=Coccinella septempunctata TaxID=41139 RepID=UPI001D060212|nr:uncharacterized protein LOC123306705 [Coccinella septempunctata]XP_044744761.1 uncharacterized protein LOC123306706 [Coccinella septempunctata]XP_044744762.1 uncharacterized protein LOC123306707 [Coccinella septempunctata]XP_044744763.1 uncharacterized protein LOC123306708 [Coccinella septempunctata]